MKINIIHDASILKLYYQTKQQIVKKKIHKKQQIKIYYKLKCKMLKVAKICLTYLEPK